MSKGIYPLKLPISVKNAATQLAKADGASLNQFIAAAAAEKIGTLRTPETFARRARRSRQTQGLAALSAQGPESGAGEPDYIEGEARRQVSFIPEIASKECWDCPECFPLCPSSAVQAAYVLTEALAFPGKRKASSQSA